MRGLPESTLESLYEKIYGGQVIYSPFVMLRNGTVIKPGMRNWRECKSNTCANVDEMMSTNKKWVSCVSEANEGNVDTRIQLAHRCAMNVLHENAQKCIGVPKDQLKLRCLKQGLVCLQWRFNDVEIGVYADLAPFQSYKARYTVDELNVIKIKMLRDAFRSDFMYPLVYKTTLRL
jgi:hypothetical protein